MKNQFIELYSKYSVGQFVSYLVVGLGATVVEWTFFWVFNHCLCLHYAIATVLAYLISTGSNWLLGRVLTFRDSREGSIIKEILSIYLASTIGVLWNLLIMYAFVEWLSTKKMIAKIIATGIVFIWNFLIRKLVIYREKEDNSN